MNHYVPDFDLEEDYSIPTSSALTRSKKPTMGEEDIMELVWENGQVVMQSQAQRGCKKSGASKFDDAVTPAGEHSSATEIRQEHHHQQQLFLHEDEMVSWLHYPLHDQDFCADLLYPSSSSSAARLTHPTAPFQNPTPPAAASARPPIPPSRKAEVVQNFSHFSRHKARASESVARGRETTVVDSSDTPSSVANCSSYDAKTMTPTAAPAATTNQNNNLTTCEMTSPTSPGGSTASAEQLNPPLDDRKRKGREEDVECHSEDADFESAEAKKSARGSTSTKRSRAAEVHNLSERRRRDRINEKMRALQELIPRCNKSDKASMLDEAIEYLKSLQLQVQMMSMGCGMVPMMFPGVQQYMTPMGMGMGMGMGINCPMMPFPNVLAGPSLPSPAAAAAHLGPRFPMPPYQMPPVPSPDPSREPSSRTDPMLSAMVPPDPNQVRVPNFADPYQQYMSLHQMQIPMPQSQAMAPPSSSRPSTGEGPDSIDNHQTGT